jgi:hypothetical protein
MRQPLLLAKLQLTQPWQMKYESNIEKDYIVSKTNRQLSISSLR